MTTEPTAGRYYEFTLGDRLRAARERAGMDQAELADVLGVTRTTISNYETGNTRPRRGVLIAIAMRTKFDLGWLETGRPPRGDGGGGAHSGLKSSDPWYFLSGITPLVTAA